MTAGSWQDSGRQRYVDLKTALSPWRGRLAAPFLQIDPTPRLVRKQFSARAAPEFTLVLIYRADRAENVKSLVSAAPKARLWALDAVHPDLAGFTVGSGPGGRSELLNHLAAGVDSPYVVLADDDVVLPDCTLDHLVSVAAFHRFDLCQPAHTRKSCFAHRIHRRRPFRIARLTNHIEVGPLLVVGPRLRDVLLPLPALGPMGWGTELAWIDAQAELAGRFAIIDAIEMVHLSPPGGSYDSDVDWAHLGTLLKARGLTSTTQAQKRLGTLWPWQALRAQDGR